MKDTWVLLAAIAAGVAVLGGTFFTADISGLQNRLATKHPNWSPGTAFARAQRRRRRQQLCVIVGPAVLAVFFNIAALLAGDEEKQNRKSESTSEVMPSVVRECLQRSGAHFAYSSDDIAFFFRAVSRDDASHPRFYVDKPAKLLIDEWRSVEFVGKRNRWLLWAAQPLAGPETLTVRRILTKTPSGSFVAYLSRPTRVRQRAAVRCLRASG
jgi:hypothetical protein